MKKSAAMVLPLAAPAFAQRPHAVKERECELASKGDLAFSMAVATFRDARLKIGRSDDIGNRRRADTNRTTIGSALGSFW